MLGLQFPLRRARSSFVTQQLFPLVKLIKKMNRSVHYKSPYAEVGPPPGGPAQENLKKDIFKALTEIKTLKEKLKQKDDLLMREMEKRNSHSRAHVDVPAELVAKENALQSAEARCAYLEVKCASLKANLNQKLAQTKATWSNKVEALKKENVSLKEQVEILVTEQNQLQEKLKRKDELVTSRIRAYVRVLDRLVAKDNDRQSSEDRCETLEFSTPGADSG